MSINMDKVCAALYGQAIGDSLGLWAEYKPSLEVRAHYPEGTPLFFERVDRDVFGYQEVWEPGQWSDDTDHALCILDAYLDDPKASLDVMIRKFAQNLLAWKERNPRGMGRHTRTVLETPGWALDPINVSAQVWAGRPKGAVPANGGVMRTSVVGLLRPYDPEFTAAASKAFCQATHYGDECVASCHVITSIIAGLVQDQGAGHTLTQAYIAAQNIDPDLSIPMDVSVDALCLDEGLPPKQGVPVRVGHTYKTMGAGVWALRSAMALRAIRTSPRQRFRNGLETIILAGGDTDTNGGVVGAVLGAYEGTQAIPDALMAVDPRIELERRLVMLRLSYPNESP